MSSKYTDETISWSNEKRALWNEVIKCLHAVNHSYDRHVGYLSGDIPSQAPQYDAISARKTMKTNVRLLNNAMAAFFACEK